MVKNTIQRMASEIEKRRNVWYSNFTFKGERIRRTLGTADEEEARKNCAKLRAELWEEQRKPVNERYTFTDAVGLWLETGKKDLSDRYRINAFKIGDKPLAEIDEPYLSTILKRYKGSTRNRVINLLHAILNCAVRKKWITEVPHMEKVSNGEGSIRWLTLEEWESLQQHLPPHLLQMARFAIATGLRENNVIGLMWRKVDMRRKVVWVDPNETKGGNPISVPLSDEAMQVLRDQIGKHDKFVFVYEKPKKKDDDEEGKEGKPVTKTSTKAWKKALVRAGIDVVTKKRKTKDGEQEYLSSTFRWHDLRHTWASWHIMSGTPLEVLQKLGGWENIEMVHRYAHLDPGHIAGYANNAKPRSLIIETEEAVDN